MFDIEEVLEKASPLEKVTLLGGEFYLLHALVPR